MSNLALKLDDDWIAPPSPTADVIDLAEARGLTHKAKSPTNGSPGSCSAVYGAEAPPNHLRERSPLRSRQSLVWLSGQPHLPAFVP